MHVAQALAATRPGGLVVVAGEKTVGIASLRKRVGAMVEIEDALGRKIWPDPRAEGPDGRAGTGLRLFVLPVADEAERDIGTG